MNSNTLDGDATNVGYVVLEQDGTFRFCSSTFRTWLGNRALSDLLPAVDVCVSQKYRTERTLLHVDGHSPRLAEIELLQLDGPGDRFNLLRIQLVPVAEPEESFRDGVTGLGDRRALANYRMRLLGEAGGSAQHAVLFLDLDNFKQINDSLGHAMGDRALAILAERWRKSLRDRDLIVRYGGDEFVVLLAGVRSHADVKPIINRLQSATSAPMQIDGHSLEVSVTIGVAFADDGGASLEALLDTADKAMYAAKRPDR